MNNTVYVSGEDSVLGELKIQISNSIVLGYSSLQWQHQKYGLVSTKRHTILAFDILAP